VFSFFKKIESFEDTIYDIRFTKQGSVTRISNLPSAVYSWACFRVKVFENVTTFLHFSLATQSDVAIPVTIISQVKKNVVAFLNVLT
jgi:hypothetical protein